MQSVSKMDDKRVIPQTELDSLKANVSPSAAEPPKIVGILVLSRTELLNKSELLLEITNQQLKLGYSREGAHAVVITAGDSYADPSYVYASIRENLPEVGERDLLSRSYGYDFRSSIGEIGKYYVIFNKPK